MNKENTWVKEFPVITDEFNLVAFDLIKVDDEPLYVVMVRYMITNDETETIDGGITIESGMCGSTYAECAALMDALVNMGFFHQSISSLGTVFDSNGDEIEDVNWGDILEAEDTVVPENVTLQ